MMRLHHRNEFILMVPITNLRVGSLENVSDLVSNPVYRDSFGLIRINGNVLKGSIRSRLELIVSSDVRGPLINLFFGSKDRAGRIIFHDFVPLFIPVPNDVYGLVFVTSPLILSEISMILGDAKGMLQKFGIYVDSLVSRFLYAFNNDSPKIFLWSNQKMSSNGGSKIEFLRLGDFVLEANVDKNLRALYLILEKLFSEVGLRGIYNDGFIIGVVSDSIHRSLLFRALEVNPHIHLVGFEKYEDSYFYNKAVKFGPWFVEEIPKFTVFIGKITFLSSLLEKYLHHKLNSGKLLDILVENCEEIRITFRVNKREILCSSGSATNSFLDKLIEIFLENFLFGVPHTLGGGQSWGRGIYRLINITKIIEGNWNFSLANRSNIASKNRNPQSHNNAQNSLGSSSKPVSISDTMRNILIPHAVGISESARNRLVGIIDRIRRVGLISLLFYYKSKTEKKSLKGNIGKSGGSDYETILKTINDILKGILRTKKDISEILVQLFEDQKPRNIGSDVKLIYENYYLFFEVLNRFRRLIEVS